jgi:beta-glucosidase
LLCFARNDRQEAIPNDFAFALHRAPEADRHVFNAQASPKDLYETYLPAFKALVDTKEADAMVGRTYRYMTAEPLYPFGFGLSYTQFEYANLKLDAARVRKGDSVRATATVKNIGPRPAEEVVQLYLTDVKASVRVPISALKGFKRVALKPGQSRTVTFTITAEMMSLIDENGQSVLGTGDFRILVGGCSPGTRGPALGAAKPAQAVFGIL